MKSIFDSNEIEKIREFNKNPPVSLFNQEPEKVYTLEFTVTDKDIANFVMLNLLSGNKDFNLGINAPQLYYSSINEEIENTRKSIKESLEKYLKGKISDSLYNYIENLVQGVVTNFDNF